ncbi:MAG: phosphoribosylglycinamide formyltransferase [Cyclobacteriaceae bacterium]
MKKLAVLASGSGSNAEKIMEYFRHSTKGKVVLVGSNKLDAHVLERAKKFKVPTLTFTRKEMIEGKLEKKLRSEKIDFLILAGFMLRIPEKLIQAFPDRIVNIHPALLPDYGGKGMYGMNVHKAVKEAGEKETGITIHLVNENYDEGKIIFQTAIPLLPEDTPEKIAEKIHLLEHKYYSNVIESLI